MTTCSKTKEEMETSVHGRSTSRGKHQLYLYLISLILISALCYAVYVTPLNVNDFLMHLFLFETQSLYKSFHRAFIDPPAGTDWRPLQLLTGHIIYNYLAEGHEHLVFKGMLVACLLVTGGLFVRLLKVATWPDVLAGVIALFVLLGHHTFGGAVEGVYPYGVEIILLACEFAVLNILLRRQNSAAWDIVAIAISIFAILLNEKGGLVGVTYIVGSVLRLPGGSIRSAAVLFAAYLAIVCFRFTWVSPLFVLAEKRASQGYTNALFDAAAPILNILISDPRFGAFRTIPQALRGASWAIVYLSGSLLLSALIIVWAWSALRQAKGSYSQELKVAAILPFLLLGSAMFGPFSPKDYVPIMALAGYAVVSFYALKWLFAETFRARQPVVYSALIVLGAGLAVTWSIRATGLFYYLRQVSFAYQYEWAIDVERLGRTHEFDASVTRPIIARLRPQGMARPLNDTDQIYPAPLARLMRGRGCPELCGK
jgi:hypothetical protein